MGECWDDLEEYEVSQVNDEVYSFFDKEWNKHWPISFSFTPMNIIIYWVIHVMIMTCEFI